MLIIIIILGIIGWLSFFYEYRNRKNCDTFWIKIHNKLIRELNEKLKPSRVEGDEWKNDI